mmetsp:Transcript_4399/g.13561  ORF Transcript_4399/g.13561 Transcript_4399/m.13561 type:complete len:205 (+) Transcript_4399:1951-2565(+)
MSMPSRRNCLSSCTVMKTYKSPGCPPLGAALPSARTRSLWPESMPFGMFTLSVLARCTTPRPSHEPQYASTCCPVPPHVGHTVCCCIRPRMVETTCVTTPVPPHVLHVLTLAPGLTPEPEHVVHVSRWLTRTERSPPKTAVLKSISRSKRRSSPCGGPRGRRPRPGPPPPPPKKLSKMSPRSKSTPGPPPPPPIPPLLTPASPN